MKGRAMDAAGKLVVRRSADRGRFDRGWLRTAHTFSFGDYFDPEHMGFRSLRVINEDHVAPGTGFGTHPHRDMEIVTCVLAGELRHRDSMGNGSVIRPSEVQRMTAGTGVTHSEENPSAEDPVHLLQIWILPERGGLVPSYEQRAFPPDEREDTLRLVASRDGRDGSVVVHQDARILAGLLSDGASVRHPIEDGRHVWLQVARGSVTAEGERLDAGDGAALSGASGIEITGRAAGTEVLVFDLA